MRSLVRRVLVRASALLRRTETDRDIDDELRYHLEREEARFIAHGLSAKAARLAARRSLGNPTAHAEAAREAVRWIWLEQLTQDARYATRSLRATPVFTAVAALSLALGVGANVTMLSTAEAVLFQRLPVREPARLVSTLCSCPHSLYRDLAAMGSPFADVAGVTIVDRTNVAVGDRRDGGLTRVALVTGSYFRLFGVAATLGRPIGLDDDETLDGHPVAVISERLWRDRLDRSPDVLRGSVQINATKYTIIGVAARGFAGDVVGRPVDVWVPVMMQSEVMSEMPGLVKGDNGFLRVIMRLQPGVTQQQAQAAMQPAYRKHEMRSAGVNASAEFLRSLKADPLKLVSIERGYLASREDARLSSSVLITIVAIVLLIACINVATLFLVRGAARSREMAIRAAIGAGAARLMRQVLTEAVALSVLGGAIGVILSMWITAALSTNISIGPVQLDVRAPSSLQSFDLRPSATILAEAVVASVVVGILFGIIPARRASRALVRDVLILRRGTLGRSWTRRRPGSWLVVAQIALSIVLLVGMGLFARALAKLRAGDLGIDRSHLLLVWTVPAQTGRAAAEYPAYLDRLIERLSRIPRVVSVSASNHGLLEGGDVGGESNLLTVDGAPAPAGMQVLRSAVGPAFFATAGLTLLEGRDFRPSDDTARARVGIMSESMARYFFGTRSAIGRRLGAPRDPIDIIGVVRDAKHGTPRDQRGVWYVTYRQMPTLLRSLCVVVRTDGDPAALRRTVALALRDFDPALPVLRVDTIAEQLDDVLFQERAIALLATVFSCLAALLACIGLYGVMAYSVARRTSEIGVRAALGATAARLARLVLAESAQIAISGVLLGLPLAIAAARFVRARLYGISAADPVTFIAAPVLMLVVAGLAGLIPARRAASVDPARALRMD